MNTKTYIQKGAINLLLLYPFILVLPIGTSFTSICLGLVTTATLLYGILNFKYFKFSKKLLIFTIPFFIYSLGLINTEDIAYGLKFISRNTTLLLFPLIFMTLKNANLPLEKLMKMYLFGALISSIYLIYLFIYNFNLGIKFYVVVTKDIFHSTYLGMYLVLASVIALNFFLNKKKKGFLFLFLFFLFSSLLTGSRIIFIVGFLITLFSGYYLISSKKYYYLTVFFTFSIFILMILFIPAIKGKFNQFSNLEKLRFDKENFHSLSSRLAKIEASIKVISKFPLFGTGTGDLHKELIVEYKKMSFTMGYKKRYNPHNQYLDNLVRNGVIGGGISILCLYIIPFIIAIRTKNKLLLSFILIVGIVSLTESILDVHRGIVFYGFFLSFFSILKNDSRESI